MNEPLFSIVIPTYNRAGTVGRAVESCLAQTERSFEIVVVDDDKSEDDMAAALAPYESRCTIRLKLDHHGKAASARNEGVRLARGRFVAFLDADDAWLPNKLAVCRSHLEREPTTLFYSRNYVDRGVGFVLFEKVRGPDARFQDMMSALYTDYKLERGFEPGEIVAKTRALKGVLEPFSSRANVEMLRRAGFVDQMTVFKRLCFEGFLAIK